MERSPKPYIIICVFLAAVLACAPPPERLVDGVIFVTLDTSRADRIGCYGHAGAITPVVDRIAAEGVMYDACIAPVPTTLASHTAMFSSLYPRSHKVPRNGFEVPEKVTTIAQILKDEGFQTSAFISGFPLTSRFGLDRGFDTYDDLMLKTPFGGELERSADKTTLPAIDWLDTVGDNPFFMWIHYFDPHWPYDPPDPYDKIHGESSGRYDPASITDLTNIRGRRVPFEREDELYFEVAYDGEMSFTDEWLGHLFAAIPESRRARTLIIITADHGEGFGEHGVFYDHGDLVFDNTVRVPLVIHAPGLFEGGEVVLEPVQLIDLAPTVLEAAGVRAPKHFEGKSLIALDGSDEPRPAFTEASKPWNVETDDRWQNHFKAKSVRTDRWKYVVIPFLGEEALFDLDADPSERRNVLAANPEVGHRLETLLTDWIRRTDPGFQTGDLTVDSDVREKLKALHYAD